MTRRRIKPPISVHRGLVAVIARDPVEVDHIDASIHNVLALESPGPVFCRLVDQLEAKGADRLTIAVVPTEAEMFTLDFTVGNAGHLRDAASEVFWEDGHGGFATIKQGALQRLKICSHDGCHRDQQQGLPAFSAVANHLGHGGLWREIAPDRPDFLPTDYILRCSPTQAGAIEYFHSGSWKFCAEPDWSRRRYSPIAYETPGS